MPTSMVVVLDSIAAARLMPTAQRTPGAPCTKAEAVVVGDVETSGTARPPHRNLRRDFRRADAGLSWPIVRAGY